MTRAERIKHKLTEALSPARLDIEDESHRHAGHAGAPEGGESHFHVTIVAEAFSGLRRLDRERLVQAALADEFSSGLHALAVTALAPDQIS